MRTLTDPKRGKSFKARRIRLHLTQEELALASQVSIPTIARLERGQSVEARTLRGVDDALKQKEATA